MSRRSESPRARLAGTDPSLLELGQAAEPLGSDLISGLAGELLDSWQHTIGRETDQRCLSNNSALEVHQSDQLLIADLLRQIFREGKRTGLKIGANVGRSVVNNSAGAPSAPMNGSTCLPCELADR